MSKLSTDEVRPHVVGDALRRHILLIIGCGVVVAALVGFFAKSQPVSYTSTAKVLVKPSLGNPFAPDTGNSGQQVTIAMETEAQVVDSAPVAALANKKLDPDWVAGSSTVNANVPANTQVIAISFTAPTAKAAQAGAQTVAQSYLDYRSAQTSATQKTRLEILTKQADAVKASLDKASKTAAADNAPPEAAQQVQLYANQLVTIQNSISTLEATGSDSGDIVAAASLPAKPNGLNPLLFAIGGGLVGLIGGVTVAIWLERRDKRLRAGSDTSVGPVPVLANLPANPSRLRALGRRVLALFGAKHATQDGARTLFQRLRTVTLATSRVPSSVAVAGVSANAPASYVAVNLGLALHRAGYGVTLVSAENSGRLEADLGIRSSRGLADALFSTTPASSLLVESNGMRVLPAGSGLGDAEALLFSERFTEILAELQAGADYVIVSSPAASSPAGMGMGVATDSLILVGIDRTTTADEVETVALRAERLDVRIMGLVAMPRRRRALLGRRRQTAESTVTKEVAPVSGARVPRHSGKPVGDSELAPVTTEGANGRPVNGAEVTNKAAGSADVDATEGMSEGASSDRPVESTTSAR